LADRSFSVCKWYRDANFPAPLTSHLITGF
jgi:hypothetical protein